MEPSAVASRPFRAAAVNALPLIMLASLTGWFLYLGVSALRRIGALGASIAASRAELAGPVVVVFLFGVLMCERLWPAEKRRLLARGHLQDGCFFLLFVTVMAPTVTMLGVASAELLHRLAPWMALSFTARWPRWLVVGSTLVAMDGCNWLAHVVNHRVRALWRVHALHHSQEELSVLTTFRVHPLGHTLSFFLATVPVIALMGGASLSPTLISVYLCLNALPHANVSWSFGPFGKVLVSPAYHRLHHSVERGGDVNFGVVLVVFDVLARRAVFPARAAAPCQTGLAERPFAVEQATLRPQPLHVLARQLLEPFCGTTGGAQEIAFASSSTATRGSPRQFDLFARRIGRETS